jgi:hypothetical protein
MPDNQSWSPDIRNPAQYRTLFRNVRRCPPQSPAGVVVKWTEEPA